MVTWYNNFALGLVHWDRTERLLSTALTSSNKCSSAKPINVGSCHLTVMVHGDAGCTQMCPSGTRCVRTPVTCIEDNCTHKFTCESEDIGREVSSIERRSVGTCPTVLPGRSGPCVEQCRRDEDCTRGRKCCYNGCGHTCRGVHRRRKYAISPNGQRTKPGFCPWYARESLNCDVQCLNDHGCPGRTKCCQTTCGSVCSEPCFHWLSRRSSNGRLWELPRRCTRPTARQETMS
ncbi:perlwapin-like [Haliotis asinina]|uniref:perlwapin-like n=1 Tax=Haliotis asinina TaxID=109174 RepID=UPI0035319AD0